MRYPQLPLVLILCDVKNLFLHQECVPPCSLAAPYDRYSLESIKPFVLSLPVLSLTKGRSTNGDACGHAFFSASRFTLRHAQGERDGRLSTVQLRANGMGAYLQIRSGERQHLNWHKKRSAKDTTCNSGPKNTTMRHRESPTCNWTTPTRQTSPLQSSECSPASSVCVTA